MSQNDGRVVSNFIMQSLNNKQLDSLWKMENKKQDPSVMLMIELVVSFLQ